MGSSSTLVVCILIAFVFILCMAGVFKTNRAKNEIKAISDSDNIPEAFKNSKLKDLWEMFYKSVSFNTLNGLKSNTPSSFYFNVNSVSKIFRVNFRFLDSASGVLVGLGLFGTFLGLTMGIRGFDSSNSDNIQQSIQNLLNGMSTAFFTSLVGMICSLIFTFFDKIVRNKLHRNIHALTGKLDDTYYIDDTNLQEQYQAALVDKLIGIVRSELDSKLMYTNEAGDNVTAGNAIREILTENMEQSKALKSFSTDLAIELNNGFDEVLSRQMQQKILPLMESVDNTTKSVIEHIDKMADTVASPASGMMDSVVEELKKSMSAIIDEFKTSLSGSATSQLETLAQHLGTASQAMGDFPQNMENISNTLQVTIEEVKNAISEISKTSANANSAAMQQMQEQIAFATSSISNAISEVKEVMNGITQSSQEQSSQMIAKLSDAAEKMGSFLDNTISSLSSSVQNSVKSITDDVTSKQADLIALQEDTTSQTKKLLEAFNVGLERLEKMNEYVTNTMDSFKQAQGEISISTGNLRTISGDMKLATELFNKIQSEYTEKLNQLQLSSQRGIDQIAELLRSSGKMTDDYAQKFELIKQGLGGIFSQLQSGLTEYSNTVKATTQKYLDQYSSSLTQTTDALSSTIQQQGEIVEMLTETLSKNR